MGRRVKKPTAVVGFDVGKSFHRAFGVGAGGEAALSERVDNRPAAIDRVLAEAGAGALVVVDQRRNIGALVLSRARAAGMRVACLPGKAEKRAREMFPATAKTDELDAEVIARTALGMPWTLREVPEEDERRASLRMLSLLMSIYLSPLSPTQIRRSRQRTFTDRANVRRRFRRPCPEPGPWCGRTSR